MMMKRKDISAFTEATGRNFFAIYQTKKSEHIKTVTRITADTVNYMIIGGIWINL